LADIQNMRRVEVRHGRKVSDTGDYGVAPIWDKEHGPGAWIVQRYADVAAALRDPRFSAARAARWVNSSVSAPMRDELREFKRILSRALLFIEGNSHGRVRRALAAGFHGVSLQQHAPTITGIADELLDAVIAKATLDQNGNASVTFDFVEDVARALPARVIANLMGIAPEIQPRFIAAAGEIAAFIGSPLPDARRVFAAQDGLLAIRDHFASMLRYPAEVPPHSLTARILRQRDGGTLSTAEMLAQCCTLLFAGYETTRHLLGNGMLALLNHPTQWLALQRAPQRLPIALRELLRYDSPVQYTGRRLREDVVVGGQTMRKGQLVILDLAAANRDPSRFSMPERLYLKRDEGNHLAFGHGPHVCLGAGLTYLEAEIAFRAVMQRLPNLQLAPHTPEWQDNAAYRGVASLPVYCSLPSPGKHPIPVNLTAQDNT